MRIRSFTVLSSAILSLFFAAGCGITHNTAQPQGPTASKKSNGQPSRQFNTVQPNKRSSSSALIPVTVAKEVDGDTIHVTMPSGKNEDVRMLLIDTPEDVDPYKPVEPFGPKAAAYAKKMLPIGKHIYLQEGKPGYKRGKYGRLLAFVYRTPNDMYNKDAVKKGLARVAYVYPPNTQHLSALKKSQQYAKSHTLGIWGIPGYVTPDGYNLSIACDWARKHGYPDSGCGSSGGSGGPTANLHILSSHLNVRPGGEASVTIKTKPGATGRIEVDYKSGPSQAHGLENKTADHSGQITWQWEVGTHTTPGNWPVHISAGGSTVTTTLKVQETK